MMQLGKHLIFTIHGIGNAQPGETAEAVFAGAAPGRTARPEAVWLPEAVDGKAHFKCEIRRSQTAPSQKDSEAEAELVIAEINWSDLSAPASGIAGVLRSLFSLVFGLEDVARALLRGAPAVLNWLSRFIAHCLKGPILAGNAALALITLIEAVRRSVMEGDASVGETANLALIGGGILVGLGSYWWTRKVFRSFNGWLVGFGLLLLAVAAFTLIPALQYQELWGVRTLMGLYGVSASYLQGLNWHGAFLLAMVQLVWLIMWMGTLLMGLGIVLHTSVTGREKTKRSARLGYLATVLMLWLTTLVVPTVWVAAQQVLPEDLIPEKLLLAGVRLMGLQWAIAVIMTVSLIVVHFLRKRRAPDYGRCLDDPVTPNLPRMIVAAPARVIMALIPVITVAVIAVIFLKWPASVSAAVIDALNEGRGLALSGMSVATVVISFFAEPLAKAVDIGGDIVNYFRLDPERMEPLDRRRVEHRLQAALDHLIELEKPTKLSLVAHSQGTVFAINEIKARPRTDHGLALITMGSPYTHIYQHYFPGFSEAIDFPAGVAWTNCYHSDDFVGTTVRGARNLCLGTGGHFKYWMNPDVVDRILRRA